jgi:hypothetical protein
MTFRETAHAKIAHFFVCERCQAAIARMAAFFLIDAVG